MRGWAGFVLVCGLGSCGGGGDDGLDPALDGGGALDGSPMGDAATGDGASPPPDGGDFVVAPIGYLEAMRLDEADGDSQAVLAASFGDVWPYGAELESAGGCTLYDQNSTLESSFYGAGDIAVTGGITDALLVPSGDIPNVWYSAPKPAFNWLDDAVDITFDAAGGPHVGAFEVTVPVPPSLTGVDIPSQVDRSEGATVTWTPEDSGEMWLIIGTRTDTNASVGNLVCTFQDTGAFEITSEALALIDASAVDVWPNLYRVGVGRLAVGMTEVQARVGWWDTRGTIPLVP